MSEKYKNFQAMGEAMQTAAGIERGVSTKTEDAADAKPQPEVAQRSLEQLNTQLDRLLQKIRQRREQHGYSHDQLRRRSSEDRDENYAKLYERISRLRRRVNEVANAAELHAEEVAQIRHEAAELLNEFRNKYAKTPEQTGTTEETPSTDETDAVVEEETEAVPETEAVSPLRRLRTVQQEVAQAQQSEHISAEEKETLQAALENLDTVAADKTEQALANVETILNSIYTPAIKGQEQIAALEADETVAAETKMTATAMLENYQRLAAEKGADSDAARQAYDNFTSYLATERKRPDAATDSTDTSERLELTPDMRVDTLGTDTAADETAVSPERAELRAEYQRRKEIYYSLLEQTTATPEPELAVEHSTQLQEARDAFTEVKRQRAMAVREAAQQHQANKTEGASESVLRNPEWVDARIKTTILLQAARERSEAQQRGLERLEAGRTSIWRSLKEGIQNKVARNRKAATFAVGALGVLALPRKALAAGAGKTAEAVGANGALVSSSVMTMLSTAALGAWVGRGVGQVTGRYFERKAGKALQEEQTRGQAAVNFASLDNLDALEDALVTRHQSVTQAESRTSKLKKYGTAAGAAAGLAYSISDIDEALHLFDEESAATESSVPEPSGPFVDPAQTTLESMEAPMPEMAADEETVTATNNEVGDIGNLDPDGFQDARPDSSAPSRVSPDATPGELPNTDSVHEPPSAAAVTGFSEQPAAPTAETNVGDVGTLDPDGFQDARPQTESPVDLASASAQVETSPDVSEMVPNPEQNIAVPEGSTVSEELYRAYKADELTGLPEGMGRSEFLSRMWAALHAVDNNEAIMERMHLPSSDVDMIQAGDSFNAAPIIEHMNGHSLEEIERGQYAPEDALAREGETPRDTAVTESLRPEARPSDLVNDGVGAANETAAPAVESVAAESSAGPVSPEMLATAPEVVGDYQTKYFSDWGISETIQPYHLAELADWSKTEGVTDATQLAERLDYQMQRDVLFTEFIGQRVAVPDTALGAESASSAIEQWYQQQAPRDYYAQDLSILPAREIDALQGLAGATKLNPDASIEEALQIILGNNEVRLIDNDIKIFKKN